MQRVLIDVLSKAAALAAVLFGIVTIIAGMRVLFGADPGYVVYFPLLYFNTFMGAVYVLVGAVAWKDLKAGVQGAAIVCALNLAVLGALLYSYAPNGHIAQTSLYAMTFRAVVWLALLLVFATAHRRRNIRDAA